MVVLLDHTVGLPDVRSLVSGMQYPEQTRDPIAFLHLAYLQHFAFMDESQALIAISCTIHRFDARDDSLLFQDGTDGQRVVGSHLPLN